MKSLKLGTWNVNGLRSVHKKNFLDWFLKEAAEIVCLQEIKVGHEQVEEDEKLLHPGGAFSHWHFAEKPGYSGLVIYSKKEPLAIRAGLGNQEFDSEGRWLEADFQLSDFNAGQDGEITVINTYWPNSQRELQRLPYKLAFCAAAEARLQELRAKGKEVYICGDFNIAHKEIDLKNPKSNHNNAGFLPQERAWMDRFVDLGWVDTFREFEKGGDKYTWWSYRPGVREKNIGWRLDYFFTNPETKDRLVLTEHSPDVHGSDHCPVRLTLKP